MIGRRRSDDRLGSVIEVLVGGSRWGSRFDIVRIKVGRS